MGLNVSVPFFPVMAFCLIIYIVNGVMNGDELSGGALSDLDEDSSVGEITSAYTSLIWGIVSFGNVPWPWLQIALAFFCNGVLILGIAVLIFELIPG